uniref:Kazal-like domain-containing protein n=1 Tax=Caenorhabditis japonica TaxID=281687 RepID=A0A8R1DFL2_CAEJA
MVLYDVSESGKNAKSKTRKKAWWKRNKKNANLTGSNADCDCPSAIRPVCGTDNITYNNLCFLRCVQRTKRETRRYKIAGVGSYSSYADEPDVEVPVTSTTLAPTAKITTENSNPKQFFTNTFSSFARNDLNRACSIAECDKLWDPVCDTRNRTHKNICQFKFYACKINKIDGSVIDIAHSGACKSRRNTCITCPKDEKAISVCDNKNMTHSTICSFIQFNCEARNNNEDDRVLVHIKSCHKRSPQFNLKEEICPRTCSRDVKPVCDEANNTHQNLCHFQQYNCNMRKLGIRSPHLRYLRPCVKNRKVDTAVENVEMKATVSNVEMKSAKTTTTTTEMPAVSQPTVASEKTTFIVSAFEKVLKSTSVETPATSTSPTTTSTSTTTSPPTTAFTGTTRTPEAITAERTTLLPEVSTLSEVAYFDCPKPNCPTDGQPVCDSAGNLHGNLCEFTYSRCLAASKGHQIHIATEENCISQEACKMPCTDDKHPICASDFSTYDNLCQFRKQKCLDQELEVLFKGKCNECLDSPCAVPADDAPDESFVCLEDQSTKSLCEYQMLSCIFERGYGVNLTVQYIGTCCPPTESCDSEKPDPVCTDSGLTFLTECELNVENCKLKKLDQPNLVIVSKGVCEKDMLTDDFSNSHSFEKPSIEFKRENVFNCSMDCDNSYDPLCGTNGVTYTNACSLQKEICGNSNSTIEVAYTGTCCDKNCPLDFSPVCDSKGSTHQNICHFGIQRCIAERTFGEVLTIEKFEICHEVKECNIQCPKEYSPVCATNGQNIINECELNKIKCLIKHSNGEMLDKDYDGECCSTESCDLAAFSPICDTEGITHANECLMRRNVCIQMKKYKKTIQVAYQGQCCNQPCEDENAPVCDGVTTYPNICKFRIAQCEADRVNRTINIDYNGECCAIPGGECETSGPVCDSEGQTHTNHCRYQQKRCMAQRTTKKSLNIVHTGECCALASCPKTGQPVCDSMGRTHDSLCHFHNSKCIFDKIHAQNTTLNLDYQGKCCPAGCTDELLVTCDQHGNIYRNTCYFNLKACEIWRRTQDVLLSTPCPLLQS